MDKLRAMHTFVNIVEGGSLTAAADLLETFPEAPHSKRLHICIFRCYFRVLLFIGHGVGAR